MNALLALGPRYFLRAGAIAVVAGIIIAVPTRLVETGWFSRMTPVRPQDYLFLVVTAALTGLVLAVPRPGRLAERAAAGSGLVTVLAVGCPICNKLVVALLGASGAMSWFAPIQPVLGVLSAVLLLVALRSRLRPGPDHCPVPTGHSARARAQR